MSAANSQARLRELLGILGQQLGGGHGWKSRAARLLGLSQAHFSRVLSGDVDAGNHTFDAVARSLFVSPTYYQAPLGTPVSAFLYPALPGDEYSEAAVVLRGAQGPRNESASATDLIERMRELARDMLLKRAYGLESESAANFANVVLSYVAEFDRHADRPEMAERDEG